jgi:phosphoheptose isomerase
MDYYQNIAENFQSTIEGISLSVDELAGPIAQASQLMVQALLEDRKIVACGNGVDAALAQLFASLLLSRFERERPALPALSLSGEGAALTAISHSSGFNEVFSRQLRALGQSGDVLLCISSGGGANNLLRAVQAAHARNMKVVALSNAGDPELGTLIRAEDVVLRIDAARQPRVVELQVMALNCLCELIDHSLFGSYN